ncbi:Flp family type IVb pilin [Salinarimonas ramus]|uniref:Fimbrial protein n=1 Tax=Salinarimonas ramus TaxID=690164 RepID=A0A917Q761_9HYPH|nr:Flp family type IVb pilin [Salinarimonas ramus]GGK32807.1 fimbrial protein [Salinarimonas ramus]
MTNLFKRFVKDESGATAIEYGLIAAVMAVLLLAVFGLIDEPMGRAFQRVADQLNAAGDATPITGAGGGGGG